MWKKKKKKKNVYVKKKKKEQKKMALHGQTSMRVFLQRMIHSLNRNCFNEFLVKFCGIEIMPHNLCNCERKLCFIKLKRNKIIILRTRKNLVKEFNLASYKFDLLKNVNIVLDSIR